MRLAGRGVGLALGARSPKRPLIYRFYIHIIRLIQQMALKRDIFAYSKKFGIPIAKKGVTRARDLLDGEIHRIAEACRTQRVIQRPGRALEAIRMSPEGAK